MEIFLKAFYNQYGFLHYAVIFIGEYFTTVILGTILNF
jgi:hypothetical protein